MSKKSIKTAPVLNVEEIRSKMAVTRAEIAAVKEHAQKMYERAQEMRMRNIPKNPELILSRDEMSVRSIVRKAIDWEEAVS